MSFQTAIPISELTEAVPAKVEVDGVPLCLVRTGGDVRALHDVCSHQQWSLADGSVYDNGVECSLHGSTFDLDTGEPSSLPATCAVQTFAARVVDGTVEVDVSVATNGAEPPRH